MINPSKMDLAVHDGSNDATVPLTIAGSAGPFQSGATILAPCNKLLHCDGDLCMLSDIGTKMLLSSTSDPKASIICGAPGAAVPSPVTHHDTNAGITEEE